MDIYVVLLGGKLIGASAKLQGAELIRVDEARRMAKAASWCCNADRPMLERSYYDAMKVENTDLRDMED